MACWIEAPDDVIAVKYSGKIARADVEQTFARCRRLLEQNATISAYVDLADFDGFATDALIEDIKDGVQALAWRTRVRRKAIVTDSAAFRALVGIASRFVAKPELRVFSSSETAQALAWASSPVPAGRN